MIAPLRRLPIALALGAISAGCAASNTRYEPQIVARGELTLRYDGGFALVGGGRSIARSLGWRGLSEYVRCVPAARAHAERAASDGAVAVALAILGGAFAGGAITTAVVGVATTGADDTPRLLAFLGAGVGAAIVGALFAGLGRLHRNRANGHAVDAMNFYNDAVGSLGATCDDLRYPSPAGPEPASPAP